MDAPEPGRVDAPTGPSGYTGRDWPGGVQDPQDPSVRELQAILGEARTIAVVGLSTDRTRDAYDVAEYLQEKGYRIVPVNPHVTEVLGEQAYPSLLDVPEKVDVVDVFRRADKTPEIARQAVEIGAKVLWLQSGIINEEAARIATEAGLDVIMGVCIRTAKRRVEREA
ncbi:MAG: CoA-binding protein [Actinomycetota bacterium]